MSEEKAGVALFIVLLGAGVFGWTKYENGRAEKEAFRQLSMIAGESSETLPMRPETSAEFRIAEKHRSEADLARAFSDYKIGVTVQAPLKEMDKMEAALRDAAIRDYLLENWRPGLNSIQYEDLKVEADKQADAQIQKALVSAYQHK